MATKVVFLTTKQAVPGAIRAAANAGDFSGKLNQVAVGYEGSARTIAVGLGDDVQPDAFVKAAISAGKALESVDARRNISVVLPAKPTMWSKTPGSLLWPGAAPLHSGRGQWDAFAVQAVETALYRYNAMKKPPEPAATPSRKSNGKGTSKKAASAGHWVVDEAIEFVGARRCGVEEGRIVADCVNQARTMGNIRPDVGTPAFYAEQAIDIAVTCKNVHVRHDIRGETAKSTLPLLYAVGQGSVNGPRLVVLEYIGAPSVDHSIALVGKGVVMDTGGLNVKPFGSMETMHMDMMGAAAVLQATNAAARLRLPVNVVAVLGLVENSVSSRSYRPSSIITSLKGTTVEVTNTDAEGRLVLADAFTFVQKKAKLEKTPTTMVDLATLTGAICVALGEHRAGLFFNDSELAGRLVHAGYRTCEPVWPMPIGPEHHKSMKGLLSDLTNCPPGRFGGACTAAAFLHHFVEKNVKWAHLDIAGAGMGTTATETNPAGAPGFGVRLLVDFLKASSRRR